MQMAWVNAYASTNILRFQASKTGALDPLDWRSGRASGEFGPGKMPGG